MLQSLRKNKVVKNAGWIIGGKVANKLLAFVVGIFAARYLGPSNYGLINYAAAYATFFASLCTLGINSVIVKNFVDHPDQQGETIGTTLLLRAMSSLLSALAIIGIVSVMDRGERLTVVVVALYSIGLIFQVFDTLNYWFQARLQSKYSAIAELVSYAAMSVYKIILLALGKSVEWFAVASALDYIVLAAFLLIAYFKNGGTRFHYSLKKAKELLQSSNSFIIAGLMVSIYVCTDKLMISFKDKILLITGGTGSFGNAVLRRFLTTDIAEIRILSRDEKKQDDMRHTYQELYPQYAEKIKFYIGDVRDYNSILNAFRGVDYVFHAAALKQVPSCEFYPMEAVKTNVAGSDNVISACVANHVKKAIFLSTDKAAYPINAMGMTKAVMEKNVIARSRQMLPGDPVLCLTRYGNVMASRGSVIPLFCDRIDEGKPLTITNPNMTRFMMTLSDAVDLVLYAFEHGEQGDLFVQKAPAATIETLAQAILELKHSDLSTTIIGTRHGEKLFEVLVTAEEMMRAEDLPGFFRIPADNRDLNYDNYFSKGNPEFGKIEQYTSHNTHRLNVEEMKQLLLKLKLFGGTC